MNHNLIFSLNKLTKRVSIQPVRSKRFNACIVLSVLLCFFTSLVQAQVKRDQSGEIEDAEIIVEKNREITLPEASRNFEKITAPARQPDPVVQKYQYIEKNIKLADLNPRFRVLQMPQEPPKKLEGNYLKAGFGNYATAYLEGFFNSTQNTDYSYGARIRHLSAGRGPVDKDYSANSENFVSVYGRYFTEALTAGAALEYNREKYYFYGYRPGRVVERNAIKQIFNTIAFKTNFTNNNKKSPLDYRLDVNVFNLSDDYNASEFEVGAQLKGDYQITDNVKAVLHTDLFLTRLKDETSLNRNFFRLKPAIRYQADALTVTAGLNTVYENDSTQTDTPLHMYPVLQAEYTFLENFALFAGFEGDMQRTTLRQFVNENPFLGPNIPVIHTNKAREIYAGVKGKLGGDLTFSAKLAHTGYKNLYFFINSRQDTSKFTTVYENDFTNVVNFTGELGYNYGDKFRLSLKSDFYNFGLSSLEEAWHRPTFTTTMLGSYNFNNKIFFNTEIYYLGGITAKNFVSNKKQDLDPILDMNIKVDYLFFDKFSAFLSFNNLLSSKYQRYLYYPNRGLNVLVGATYSF